MFCKLNYFVCVYYTILHCILIMLNNNMELKVVSFSYQMLLGSIENMNILNKTTATYAAATSLKTFKTLSEGLKPFSQRKMMQFACIYSNYHHHPTFSTSILLNFIGNFGNLRNMFDKQCSCGFWMNVLLNWNTFHCVSNANFLWIKISCTLIGDSL